VVEWSEPLRDELKWLGGLLGDVRDTEVQMDRMRAHMEGLPEEDQLVHLLDGLAERRTKGREALVEALRGDRYVTLLDRLVESAREPAVLPEADKPAEEMLPDLVVKPWRKLRKAVKALGDPPADAELHAVRIRAKRARYAAEAVAPAFGKKAEEFAKAAADLQDVLGEHQDAVVAQDWLRKAVARAKPGLAFAAGQLAALEIQAMREARQAWPKAWKKVRRRSPDHW
jgi:CHAD domain-containing protein